MVRRGGTTGPIVSEPNVKSVTPQSRHWRAPPVSQRGGTNATFLNNTSADTSAGLFLGFDLMRRVFQLLSPTVGGRFPLGGLNHSLRPMR